jgi:hypothetical protein
MRDWYVMLISSVVAGGAISGEKLTAFGVTIPPSEELLDVPLGGEIRVACGRGLSQRCKK